MRAVIVAVGSELLSTDRLDTNSLRVTAALERRGVRLARKAIVGDDEAEIEEEIRRALADVELVVTTGGLGPTEDDLTREAVARALGRRLVEDPEIVLAIERRFASFGRTPSANNRRQAQVVEGAVVLPNPRGTAPGLRVATERTTLFLFPGVPHELELMIGRDLDAWLAGRTGGRSTEKRILRVALRPESEVDLALAPVYEEFGREAITVLATPGEVRIVLGATGSADEISSRLDGMEERARAVLGDALFGSGEGSSLEAVVGALLVERGLSAAFAESCTGGLVSARLTDVAGASRYFPGGVVTYSNEAKQRLLDVPRELLEEHGAVSEPVARAMAVGVRLRLGSALGVAITGIAGPDGGSEEKPVGTVHVAVSGPGSNERHRLFRFPGDRERIRRQAAQAALELTRRALLDLGASPR